MKAFSRDLKRGPGRFLVLALASSLASSFLAPGPLVAAAKPAPAPPFESVDGGWPRVVKTSAGVFTLYQPQLDAWDGLNSSFAPPCPWLEKKAPSQPSVSCGGAQGLSWIARRGSSASATASSGR